MADVVAAFAFGELVEQLAAGFPERLDGPLFRAFEQPLEFGKRLLDRIEIGTVRRQVNQAGALRLDGLLHAHPLMAGQVVHDHDVALVKRRRQLLLNVSQ